LGKYLEFEEIEAPEKMGIPSWNYNYYSVTDRKLVRIFTSEKECWYKVYLVEKSQKKGN